MAWSIESLSSYKNTTDSTSHALTLPATITEGSVLVFMGSLEKRQDADPSMNEGWTFLGRGGSSASNVRPSDCVFYKVATASEANPTITFNPANGLIGTMFSITGVTVAGIATDSISTDNSVTVSCPTLPNASSALVIRMATVDAEATTFSDTPPTTLEYIRSQNSTLTHCVVSDSVTSTVPADTFTALDPDENIGRTLLIPEVGSVTVTPDDPITDGETGNAYAKTGFTSGDVTGITLDGVALTTFDQTTFDNIDITAVSDNNGTVVPAFGSVVFEATNGTETANATITNNVKAGWAQVTLTTIDTVTTDSLYNMMLNQLSKTIATGDIFYYPNSDGSSITNDSNWEFYTLPKSFVWIDATDGKAYPLTMTEDGVTGMVGFTRVGEITLPTLAGSHTDFVMVLKWADFHADVIANLDDGGGDLRFSSDSAGISQLACEVVTFDKVGNEAEVYVGPFSASTGTVIHVWGDNTGATQPAVGASFGRNAVWTDYEAVYHLDDATDATGNGRTLALTGTASFVAGGKFGGGLSVDGVDGRADGSLSGLSYPFTMSAWGNTDTIPSPDQCLLGVADSSIGTDQIRLQIRSDDFIDLSSYDGTNDSATSTFQPTTSQYYKTTGLVTAANSRTVYANGANPSTSTGGQTHTLANYDRVTLGVTADSTPYGFFDGTIDEARVRNSALSATYILDEYDNQSAGAWVTMTAVELAETSERVKKLTSKKLTARKLTSSKLKVI